MQVSSNSVNHPVHYTSHPSGVECIEITRHFNFNVGNAIKYLWRAGLKHENSIEDLEKTLWYVKDEIKRLKNQRKSPRVNVGREVDSWKARLTGINNVARTLPRGTVIVRVIPNGSLPEHFVPKNGAAVKWLENLWEYDEDINGFICWTPGDSQLIPDGIEFVVVP